MPFLCIYLCLLLIHRGFHLYILGIWKEFIFYFQIYWWKTEIHVSVLQLLTGTVQCTYLYKKGSLTGIMAPSNFLNEDTFQESADPSLRGENKTWKEEILSNLHCFLHIISWDLPVIRGFIGKLDRTVSN